MTTVWENIKWNACMILILVSGVAQAQQIQPTEGTNLARGKACTFDPKPSYPDCTEKGDRFDLTALNIGEEGGVGNTRLGAAARRLLEQIEQRKQQHQQPRW